MKKQSEKSVKEAPKTNKKVKVSVDTLKALECDDLSLIMGGLLVAG